MKRILILLCLLLLPSALFAETQLARMNPWIAGGVNGAVLSCTGSTNQMETYVANGEVNLGSASTLVWRATKHVYAGTTGTLCRIDSYTRCYSDDNCTDILTGYIYSHDAGNDAPDVATNTCTGTYDTAPLTTTAEWISYTSCSGTITNGSTIWIVEQTNESSGSYIKLSTDSTCTTERMCTSSSGEAGSWTCTTGDCTVKRMYILE